MATALNIKRKNIDLPVETLQKLSIMAVAQGKSLKKYIETLLISKADSLTVESIPLRRCMVQRLREYGFGSSRPGGNESRKGSRLLNG